MRKQTAARLWPGRTELIPKSWGEPVGTNLFGKSARVGSSVIPPKAHGQCTPRIDRGYPSFGNITALTLHAKTN